MIWLLVAGLLGLAILVGGVGSVILREVQDQRGEHAKCVAHIASVTSNRVVAVAFRDAAERWDSIEEQADLQRLAREKYQPGGPSMPTLWMREQADKLDPLP